MKKTVHIFLILLIATGCKNRRVATMKNRINDKSIITFIKHNTAVLTDTGKITSGVRTSKTTRDSALVIITPDTGTVQVINISANNGFNYAGKAKQIIYKSGAASQNLLTKMKRQQNVLSVRQTSMDRIVDKKNVIQNTQSKNITTKISNRLWATWLTLLLLVLFSIYYIKIKNII